MWPLTTTNVTSHLLPLSLPSARVGVWTFSELDQLVTCCPGLTSLGLQRALYYKVTLHPLLKLTALQSLSLVPDRAVGALGVLQEMTGLRSLTLGGF
jgi:hypothetical protein